MKKNWLVLFFNFVGIGFVWGEKSPNVLFIAIDDLNDWIGCLGGHPQTKTPNLDGLAASGTLFTNAHCPAPACNPSRSAIFTGISPHISGLYRNEQKMRDVLPDAELLPKTFSKAGYRAEGSGKMLHYFIDAQSWDEYFPARETENPFPKTMSPPKRPVTLIRGGSWQYYETDWGPINATDREYGGDYTVVEWVGKRLSQKREKPFFLACGIYRPHEPWFVPKKYFDAFPIDEIKLPPGYLRHDLEDIPNRGKQLARNRYFAHILEQNQWKQAIQGYLASIHFADAMLGHLLLALKKGPNAKNTIVVLWSDHGWHLGEKEHWQKFTLWRACTRVPLIIRVPSGISRSLVSGTQSSLCSKPVNLLSLAPTLFELCDLDSSSKHDGPSLVPLLKNPNASWDHVSLTHLQEPGSYSLSEENWRYIKYANGEEELYNIKKDPFEWENLLSSAAYTEHLKRLRKKGPTEFAKLFVPKLESLSNLKWFSLSKGKKSPPSKPVGHSFDTRFINHDERAVELFWIDRKGNPVPYAIIKPGGIKVQRTRAGAVWQISQTDGPKHSKPLGYFVIKGPNSKGIIKFP